MTVRFRRGWWIAGLLLAAVPLAAAAQVGSGFGFRYRNASMMAASPSCARGARPIPGGHATTPAMENNLARVLHDITTLASQPRSGRYSRPRRSAALPLSAGLPV